MKCKWIQMLDEDLYWRIVDESLINSNNQAEQREFLVSRLQDLSTAEIIGFKLRTDKLLYDTYNPTMWCAAYIMNRGRCSDDSFQYFRCWVISRGKDTYYKAKNSPDSLVDHINLDWEFYDFELFWYVALYAFKGKTGVDMYKYIDDGFAFSEAKYPKIQFNWNAGEPETMRAICPKLFNVIWEADNI